MVSASFQCLGCKAEGGIGEPAQRGGFGKNRRAAELGEHARGRGADGDGRRVSEQLLEMLAPERALELDDGGRAREGDGADLVAIDPRAALATSSATDASVRYASTCVTSAPSCARPFAIMGNARELAG